MHYTYNKNTEHFYVLDINVVVDLYTMSWRREIDINRTRYSD